MKIEILGPGCAKCMALEKNVRSALTELNKEADIEHVADLDKMTEYGIMVTPALIIDGQMKASGKVLSADEIKEMIG